MSVFEASAGGLSVAGKCHTHVHTHTADQLIALLKSSGQSLNLDLCTLRMDPELVLNRNFAEVMIRCPASIVEILQL